MRSVTILHGSGPYCDNLRPFRRIISLGTVGKTSGSTLASEIRKRLPSRFSKKGQIVRTTKGTEANPRPRPRPPTEFQFGKKLKKLLGWKLEVGSEYLVGRFIPISHIKYRRKYLIKFVVSSNYSYTCCKAVATTFILQFISSAENGLRCDEKRRAQC